MDLVTVVSTWFIPVFIAVVLLAALIKRVAAYEVFVEGGKEGLSMAVNILPFLVGMLISVSVFRASGALEAIVEWA
ncbi:MAG: spore maturation protein, partial [Bacilli bacterium]